MEKTKATSQQRYQTFYLPPLNGFTIYPRHNIYINSIKFYVPPEDTN